MSSALESESAVRVSSRLGPRRSPRSRGWQDAYDPIVEDLLRSGGPICSSREGASHAGFTP